jgi:CRISPR-associated protein Csm5
MPKKQYKLTIEPITAVHIGTGEEITPLDYKLSSNLGTKKLPEEMYLKFSSEKILSRLIESKNTIALSEFEKASTKGNIKELQIFFQTHCADFEDLDYPCEATKEFKQLYNHNKEKDPYENAARVNQIYRPAGLKTPCIPGSSLKGAVRTAVLNKVLYDLPDSYYNNLLDDYDACRNNKAKERFENKLQSVLLNDYRDAKNDPFRCVEFGDCSFPAKNSQLVGVLKNISKNKSSGSIHSLDKLQIQAEVIKGSMMSTYAEGLSIIRINSDLQDTQQVTRSITMKDIIESCNTFYLTQFSNEYENFYSESVDTECDLIMQLKKTLTDITEAKNNTFILRVGRWSQVEFVTFGSDFRNPKTREVRGQKLGYGGTRTVFNYDGQYLPLGWCKCEVTEIK